MQLDAFDCFALQLCDRKLMSNEGRAKVRLLVTFRGRYRRRKASREKNKKCVKIDQLSTMCPSPICVCKPCASLSTAIAYNMRDDIVVTESSFNLMR